MDAETGYVMADALITEELVFREDLMRTGKSLSLHNVRELMNGERRMCERRLRISLFSGTREKDALRRAVKVKLANTNTGAGMTSSVDVI